MLVDATVGIAVPVIVGLPFLVDPDGTASYRPGAVLLGVLVAVAVVRGLRAACFTGVVSTLIVWFGFGTTRNSFALESVGDAFALVVYATTVGLVLLLVKRLSQFRRAEVHQRALVDTLLEEAPVGLAFFDTDLRFRLVNSHLGAIDGIPPREHLGVRPTELAADTGEVDEALLARVRDSNVPLLDQDRSAFVPRSGQMRHWRTSYFPVRNEYGEVEGVGAVVSDVTNEILSQRRRNELLGLAESLVGLTTLDEVARLVVEFAAESFDARASFGLVTEDRDELEILALHGYDRDVTDAWTHRRIALTRPTPVTDAARTARFVTVSSPAEMARTYPAIAASTASTPEEACASVPLTVVHPAPPAYGVLHISWPYPRELTQASRVTLLTVAAIIEAAARRVQDAERAASTRFEAALGAILATVTIASAIRVNGRIEDFRIEYVNQPTVGWPPQPTASVVGRTMRECYPGWVESGRLDQLASVVETGVPLVEERINFDEVQPDGDAGRRFFSYQAVPFDDGYLLFSHDVTDSVLADERARDLERERQARNLVDAMATLTASIAPARTTREVAESACLHGPRAAEAELVTVAVRADANTFAVYASSDEGQVEHPALEIDLGVPGPFSLVLKRGEPLLVTTLDDYATQPLPLVRMLADAGFKSVAFNPVIGDDGAVLGAVGFGWRTPQQEDTASLRRMNTVVDVVRAALQRVTAEEAERTRRIQADRLAGLTAELSGATDAEAIEEIALRWLGGVFDAVAVGLARRVATDAAWVWRFAPAAEGSSSPPVIGTDQQSALIDLIGPSIAILPPDGAEELDRASSHHDAPAVGAIAGIPLGDAAAVDRVIAVALSRHETFDENARALLDFTRFALSQALTRADLFARERSRREFSEALQRVSIDAMSDRLDDPLRGIGRRAAELFGCAHYATYSASAISVEFVEGHTGSFPLLEEHPLTDFLPVTDAARTGRPIVVANPVEWADRYPSVQTPLAPTLALPVKNERADVVGVLVFGFVGADRLPALMLDHLDDIADAWSALYQRLRAAARERSLAEREHVIATSLQAAMLGQPDDAPRAAWGATYRQADRSMQVGGDWYDLIALSDDRVALVVGDVVGHHVGAAGTMGQIRSAVRALTSTIDDPAEILTRLDQFAYTIEGAAGTTVFFGVLDCGRGHLRYSCAGHPPPLLVTAEGPQLLMDARNGPLAAMVTRRRENAEIVLSADDFLIAYTDGLIERRGESLEVGFARLAHHAVELRDLDPTPLCDALVRELLAGAEQRDDIAVLAIRPLPTELHLTRVNSPASVRAARHLLTRWLRTAAADGTEIDEVVLSVGEALANAMEHGNAAAAPRVELHAETHDGVVRITVRDNGQWREPTIDHDGVRGRGMTIMAELMDVSVDSDGTGTTVELTRRLASLVARAEES